MKRVDGRTFVFICLIIFYVLSLILSIVGVILTNYQLLIGTMLVILFFALFMVVLKVDYIERIEMNKKGYYRRNYKLNTTIKVLLICLGLTILIDIAMIDYIIKWFNK